MFGERDMDQRIVRGYSVKYTVPKRETHHIAMNESRKGSGFSGDSELLPRKVKPDSSPLLADPGKNWRPLATTCIKETGRFRKRTEKLLEYRHLTLVF
jgi:hypothetical protein